MAPDQHSTYVTALALLMLLECRQARIDCVTVDDDETQDVVIQKAAQWLVYNHDYGAPSPGWREHPWDRTEIVSPPLSLFVTSMLSQTATVMAEMVASLAAPAVETLRQHFKTYAVAPLDQDGAETTARIRVWIYKYDKPGERQLVETTTGFLWYPWAIEITLRGIARAQALGWAPVESTRAHQNLGRLVIERSQRFLKEARDPETFTYKAAELAYVLEQLRGTNVEQVSQSRSGLAPSPR